MGNISKVMLSFLMIGFLMVACNQNKKVEEVNEELKEQNEDTSHNDQKEVHDHGYEMAMATYQCPMKCEGEKTYAEEGSCPECKMDLKKNETSESQTSQEEDKLE